MPHWRRTFCLDFAGYTKTAAGGQSQNQCHVSGHNGARRAGGNAAQAEAADVYKRQALYASHVDAALIHEAAIGKIAGEQILKLKTLGLTEEQAEEKIIQGFLK